MNVIDDLPQSVPHFRGPSALGRRRRPRHHRRRRVRRRARAAATCAIGGAAGAPRRSRRPTRLTAIVPAGLDGGRTPVRIDEVAGRDRVRRDRRAARDRACTRWTARRSIATATSTSPSAARAASRRRSSIFLVRPDGTREPFVVGHRQSRRRWRSIRDGRAVRVEPLRRQRLSRRRRRHASTIVATDLGVACGLAFAPDGTLFVGDRSGIDLPRRRDGTRDDRSRRCRRASPRFTSRSVRTAAVRDRRRRSASHDCVYRIVARRRRSTICYDGFGRPQGLAFDARGDLYVVDALAGVERPLPAAADRPASPSWCSPGGSLIGARVRSARRPRRRVERHGVPASTDRPTRRASARAA